VAENSAAPVSISQTPSPTTALGLGTHTLTFVVVPTSSQDGPFDMQAGDVVVGGWRYLVNAGGSTVYSGELAVELLVADTPPRMEIVGLGSVILLSWPATARDFILE